MLNGTDNFHGPIPSDADVYFVVHVFQDVLTVVKVDNNKFDIYNNNRLTQPGHDYAGVMRYIGFVYSNNPNNPDMIADHASYAANRASQNAEATGQFIGLSNAVIINSSVIVEEDNTGIG